MGTRPLADADDFDPAIAELIRRKARAMSRLNHLSHDDEQDFRQDLAVDLLEAFSRHDVRRGSRLMLARTVVMNRAIDRMRQAYAQKRSRKRLRRFADGCGGSVRAQVDSRDTVLDIRAALAFLPIDLRAIATLFERHSEAEVIRLSGLSRQQVRGIKARIGEHFDRCGLGVEKISCNLQPTFVPLAYITSDGSPHRAEPKTRPAGQPSCRRRRGSLRASPPKGASDDS